MDSDYEITRISMGKRPAIHSYFDLCPESPDRRRAVYFEFMEEVPGPGHVVVADVNGENCHVISRITAGNAHAAVRQQWLDNDAVAFCRAAAGETRTVIMSLADETARELRGALRMFSKAAGLGLSSSHEMRMQGAEEHEEAVYVMDFGSGKLDMLFTRDQVIALHPLRDQIEKPEDYRFKHTKWAPDGSRFFFVFYTKRKAAGEKPIKSLFAADADGGNLHYVSEFGHHPMWDPQSEFIYAYARNERGKQDMIAYDPEQGTPRVLVNDIPGVHASLGPDRASVVTDIYNWPERGQGAILLFDVASRKHKSLARMAVQDTSHEKGCHPHPVWSRDGSRVYFNSADSGMPQLYALDL